MWMKLLLCASLLAPSLTTAGEPGRLRILATTYPIQLLTRTVAAGVANVQVELLLPPSLGCPHDYSLTPEDLRKLEATDVLVVNGLGMEEFLGAPLARGRPALRVIDASKGLAKVLHDRDDGDDAGPEEVEHGDAPGHEHAGPNPHHFAGPRAAAQVVRFLAEELARVHPAGATRFRSNAATAAARLDALADAFRSTTRRLANRRLVTQHGVFDYLADDAGLEIVAVIADHPGQEPSAARLLRLVAAVRARRAGAIVAEPQYPARVAETLARETGIPVATLDPVATGPAGAGLEHYIATMERNRRILEETLGVH
jgi:zinc transport system substrate-binding protein